MHCVYLFTRLRKDSVLFYEVLKNVLDIILPTVTYQIQLSLLSLLSLLLSFFFFLYSKLAIFIILHFFLELSKSEDALRPFVLACETKQVKLVTIAIGCIQKLISFHAIPEVIIYMVICIKKKEKQRG